MLIMPPVNVLRISRCSAEVKLCAESLFLLCKIVTCTETRSKCVTHRRSSFLKALEQVDNFGFLLDILNLLYHIKTSSTSTPNIDYNFSKDDIIINTSVINKSYNNSYLVVLKQT